MAKEVGLKIDGLRDITKSLKDATEKVPASIRWALARAADEIRDEARSNVQGSPYNLSHDMYGIRSRMSKKYPFTSEIGYFTDDSNWHIKFFERTHARQGRGTIKGGRFMGQVRSRAESIAQTKVEEGIRQALRDLGL